MFKYILAIGTLVFIPLVYLFYNIFLSHEYGLKSLGTITDELLQRVIDVK